MDTLNIMESFPVSIPHSIHKKARQFSAGQSNSHQAENIYANMLAVYATHYYLRCMGIQVDQEGSDGLDRIFQTLSTTGALMLKDIGKLECCPVFNMDDRMQVSEAVWGDRIGYIAVQLSADLSSAYLIGFVPAVSQGAVPLSNLDSLANFLDHVDALKRESLAADPQSMRKRVAQWSPSHAVNNLAQWLTPVIESGWQQIEVLLDGMQTHSRQPALNFRQLATVPGSTESEIIWRGKIIHLNEQTDTDALGLIVGVSPKTNAYYQVRIRLYPTATPYLIPGLKVSLIKDGEVLSSNQMSSKQPYFEMKLTTHRGDRFSYRVRHVDTVFEQSFILETPDGFQL